MKTFKSIPQFIFFLLLIVLVSNCLLMDNDKSSTVLQNRNEKSTIYSMDGAVVLGFIQQ